MLTAERGESILFSETDGSWRDATPLELRSRAMRCASLAPTLPSSGPILGYEEALNSEEVLLPGSEVIRASGIAVSRWPQILLIEDDAALSHRRGSAGVAEKSSTVVITAHRIDKNGVARIATRSYKSEPSSSGIRFDLALQLVDEGKPIMVVSGSTYGCSSQFLAGLSKRSLSAIVELRPSTQLRINHSLGQAERLAASACLAHAEWEEIRVGVPGQEERTVRYAVAVLGAAQLESGIEGVFFAAQRGAIPGVHPGTIFGFCVNEAAESAELVQAIGWARWIRPVARSEERKRGLANARSNAVKADRSPRLRANITASRTRDEMDAFSLLSAERQYSSHLGANTAIGAAALRVVELFAGAGGMGLGFMLAGDASNAYRIIYSGEVDPICVRTLTANRLAAKARLGLGNETLPEGYQPVDLRESSTRAQIKEMAESAGGADIVIGGPPCQGFSSANRNSWNSSNPNNQLIDVFLDYVENLSPKYFLLENVQGIHWTRKHGESYANSSVLNHIRSRMENLGFFVFVQLLDAVWYGVPQFRNRFFILGLHRDMGFRRSDFDSWGPFPRPRYGPGTGREYSTVRDAISDLPIIGNAHDAELIAFTPPASPNSFLCTVLDPAEEASISDHVTSNHAAYVIERFRKIPAGENWESIKDMLSNYAHVERTHSNIYRRLLWDEPSITIGHYRKSMLVHPSQDRGLSLREASRLQSFPDWFRFAGTPVGPRGGLVHKQQQLANAVCPAVTKAIADTLLELR